MRVVVLSSQQRGFGSYCVQALAAAPGIEVAAVIECEGIVLKPWRRRWRKLKKTLQIGPLGALNGVRMRKWYDLTDRLGLESLREVALQRRIPFATTPSLVSARTVELCREAGADLGLSLGNGYIPERVFSIPRLGMINVHHELLPEYKGAQSVIWPLHAGVARTGFTIHRIDNHIDTGEILYRQELDIVFGDSLGATVHENYARLWEASRAALVRVVADYDSYLRASHPQGPGRSFTTPSWSEFRQIARNHESLRMRAAGAAPP
jgi:methionyl-tRNA formyltransferase